jgi:hypothetical protein
MYRNIKTMILVRFEVLTLTTTDNAAFWMWRRVALLLTDFSKENITYISKMKKLSEV